MAYEKYSHEIYRRAIDYITPAFPEGRRVQEKTADQIEQDRALRAQREHEHVVVQALRTLTSTEGWDSYTSQLTILEAQFTEDLVKGEPADHDYIKGYIMGLRRAVGLPAELAKRSRENAGR